MLAFPGAADDARERVAGLQDGELELTGYWVGERQPVRRMITIVRADGRTLLELEVVDGKIRATYREEDLDEAARTFADTLGRMTVGPITLVADDWMRLETGRGRER